MSETSPTENVGGVEAADRGGLELVFRGDSGYEAARAVKNARFDRHPAVIAYCRTADHVSFCFKMSESLAEFHGIPIVVRSGGHQHEGRSVDNDSFVIDVSRMDAIGEVASDATIWLETAAPLREVGEYLAAKGLELPIGGCGSVRAGGLTQGGGWGLSWRYLGMTIDKLLAVEIVTVDGTIQTVSAEVEPELFRSIRGGGGGNFGVITKLQFQLSASLSASGTQNFLMVWDAEHRVDVACAWAKLMASEDLRFDTFARFGVVHEDDDQSQPMVVSGRFRGSRDECIAAMQPLTDVAEPKLFCFPTSEEHSSDELVNGSFRSALSELAIDTVVGPDTLASLPPHAFALQPGPMLENAAIETCGSEPVRHKVSSRYPLAGDDEVRELFTKLADVVASADVLPGSNRYVSLHGMGGAGGAFDPDQELTAYPWRDKAFLVQIQSWWLSDADDEEQMRWVQDLALEIKSDSEGGFISFPDEDLEVVDYYRSEDRLARLRDAKDDWDPAHRLAFKLGLREQPLSATGG